MGSLSNVIKCPPLLTFPKEACDVNYKFSQNLVFHIKAEPAIHKDCGERKKPCRGQGAPSAQLSALMPLPGPRANPVEEPRSLMASCASPSLESLLVYDSAFDLGSVTQPWHSGSLIPAPPLGKQDVVP